MDSYGFESVRELPGNKEGLLILGAILGAGASLLGGALKKNPEQQLQYPNLKKNPIMALAMIKSMMNAPKYNFGGLPEMPDAPGLPDYATMLAKARGV